MFDQDFFAALCERFEHEAFDLSDEICTKLTIYLAPSASYHLRRAHSLRLFLFSQLYWALLLLPKTLIIHLSFHEIDIAMVLEIHERVRFVFSNFFQVFNFEGLLVKQILDMWQFLVKNFGKNWL